MSDHRIWVVVPAYNEAATAPAVIAQLRSLGYRVACVDDGSVDGTPGVARRSGAEVITHPVNLGQGAAIQTGIEHALARGADYICTFDADGQHDPEDLAALIGALQRCGADFALGSRFLGKTVDMPASRRAILSAAVFFTRLVTGLPITDTHNGMRAMTRRGASCIHLRQDRMAHASEILVQIRDSDLPYVEVPVTISYTAYSLRKGQRTASALTVLGDMAAGILRS